MNTKVSFWSEDTIAALATPNGVGAVALIRVSGKDTFNLLEGLLKGRKVLEIEKRKATLISLHFNEELIDEVILTLFKGPNSYTGEDCAEITCHGSSFIVKKILEALSETGIRPAEAGEFTMRAFLNGKLDLTQAEAVADLIAAESESAHRNAMNQLRGGLSKKITGLRQELLDFASLLELELDFGEEDVEFADRTQLGILLNHIKEEVSTLFESFKVGNAVKSGIKVVIAGRPNAGKSTLLNAFLQEERAMVSEIPGTTRDTIEDTITINGILFRFIDTAGIRETSDVLENMGIERTISKMEEADLILYLFDINTISEEDLKNDLSTLPNSKTVIPTGNKLDLSDGKPSEFPAETLYISASKKEHLEELKTRIFELLNLNEIDNDGSLITNLRHYDELKKILISIQEIKEGLAANLSTDLLAFHLRDALQCMGRITGQELTNDELLGNIFSRFCIGK